MQNVPKGKYGVKSSWGCLQTLVCSSKTLRSFIGWFTHSLNYASKHSRGDGVGTRKNRGKISLHSAWLQIDWKIFHTTNFGYNIFVFFTINTHCEKLFSISLISTSLEWTQPVYVLLAKQKIQFINSLPRRITSFISRR